jgi:hypothetical protein
MSLNLHLFAAPCALLAALALSSQAHGDGGVRAESADHTLGGHVFNSPILSETAFVTTHFGIRQGLAYLNVPSLPSPIGPTNLTLAGFQQDFDLGLKVTDWLGVVANGSGSLLSGTNVESLVLSESSFAAGGEGGVVLRLARLEQTGTQLSMRLTGGAGIGRKVDVKGLLTGLLADPQKTFDNVLRGKAVKYIFSPQSTNTFALSLLAAQALSPNFSLQASVVGRRSGSTDSAYDGASNTRIDQTTHDNELVTSLAFTADGAPSHVPVALMVEYSLDVDKSDEADSETDAAHLVGAGIYYSGRPHLQVGLGGYTRLGMRPIAGLDENGAPVKSGSPSFWAGQFILRYTW